MRRLHRDCSRSAVGCRNYRPGFAQESLPRCPVWLLESSHRNELRQTISKCCPNSHTRSAAPPRRTSPAVQAGGPLLSNHLGVVPGIPVEGQTNPESLRDEDEVPTREIESPGLQASRARWNKCEC